MGKQTRNKNYLLICIYSILQVALKVCLSGLCLFGVSCSANQETGFARDMKASLRPYKAETASFLNLWASLKPTAPEEICSFWLAAWAKWVCGGDFIVISIVKSWPVMCLWQNYHSSTPVMKINYPDIHTYISGTCLEFSSGFHQLSATFLFACIIIISQCFITVCGCAFVNKWTCAAKNMSSFV